MKQLILLLTTLLGFSCSYKSDNSEIQKLYDEVMLVHDEVMPEMSTIHRLKKAVKKRNGQDSTALDLILELNFADEAMMTWMADFKPDKSMHPDSQIVYLKSEKEKITAVSELMKSTILKAKNYVKQ